MMKIVGMTLKPMLLLAHNLGGVTSFYPLITWAPSSKLVIWRSFDILLFLLLKQSRPMANSSINMGSYRTLFPFFLIIAVVLLLVWRLIVSPGLTSPTKKCPEGTSSYWAQPGNNCWELSRKNGWTLDKFKEINPAVDCDPLMPGTSICLPPPKKQIRRRVWSELFGSNVLDTYVWTSDIFSASNKLSTTLTPPSPLYRTCAPHLCIINSLILIYTIVRAIHVAAVNKQERRSLWIKKGAQAGPVDRKHRVKRWVHPWVDATLQLDKCVTHMSFKRLYCFASSPLSDCLVWTHDVWCNLRHLLLPSPRLKDPDIALLSHSSTGSKV